MPWSKHRNRRRGEEFINFGCLKEVVGAIEGKELYSLPDNIIYEIDPDRALRDAGRRLYRCASWAGCSAIKVLRYSSETGQITAQDTAMSFPNHTPCTDKT